MYIPPLYTININVHTTLIHHQFTCIYHPYTQSIYMYICHPYTQLIYMYIPPLYTINIDVHTTRIYNQYTCIYGIHIHNQNTCIYHPYTESIYRIDRNFCSVHEEITHSGCTHRVTGVVGYACVQPD